MKPDENGKKLVRIVDGQPALPVEDNQTELRAQARAQIIKQLDVGDSDVILTDVVEIGNGIVVSLTLFCPQVPE